MASEEDEDSLSLGLQYLEEWGLSKSTINNFAENGINFKLIEKIQDPELRELIPNIKERILFKTGLEKLHQIIHTRLITIQDKSEKHACSILLAKAVCLVEVRASSPRYSAFIETSDRILDTASEDTASINGDLMGSSLSSSSSTSGVSNRYVEKSPVQIDLKQILTTTNCGEMCLASANKPLDNALRNQIVRTVVEYYIKRYNKMTSQDFDVLSDQIVMLFPSECKETYYIPSRKVGEKTYIPAQAKLPTRYRNQLRVLRKSGVVTRPPTSGTSSDNNEDTIPGSSADISPEEAEEHKLWLKFNKEPWVDILDKWNQTRKYRAAFIAEEKNTIQDILTEWPSLKASLGYKLIEADFDAMHPHCELNLFKKWPLFMEKARPILKTLKSPDINLLDENLQEDATNYIFFKLMSCKMSPTVKVPIKENGKKRFYKPSIVESQNSFILHVTNQSEIKNKLEQYQKMHLSRGTTFQPLVIAVGPTSEDLKDFYVAVESVLYKVDQLLKAVDVCFKVIHVTNVQYPLECLSVWSFIQKYFYNLHNNSDKKISSVYCFISDLTD